MAKKSTAIAKKDTGAVSVPSYLDGYQGPTGSEDIGNEDVTIPRIKLAQGLTPEVKDGTVPDGSLFLNVSGEVLAQPGKTLRFTPVAVGKEFILWNPKRGEGILARGRRVIDGDRVRYEWDKQGETFDVQFKNGPKVKWTTKQFVDENGMDQWGSANPNDPDSGIAATAHHNYVVTLPDHDNMIAALSLSRSQVKRAKDLNALFKMGKAPIFARVFEVRSDGEKNEDGEFFNYKFVPAGFVEDAEMFADFKAMHDGFKDRGFNVDQSDEDNEDGSAGTSI